jgi:hypothetical protein
LPVLPSTEKDEGHGQDVTIIIDTTMLWCSLCCSSTCIADILVDSKVKFNWIGFELRSDTTSSRFLWDVYVCYCWYVFTGSVRVDTNKKLDRGVQLNTISNSTFDHSDRSGKFARYDRLHPRYVAGRMTWL